MAEVRIRINGRDYDIACDDGQEGRVRELGQVIDKTFKDIAQAGAASNEAHLFVLTSLVLADEVYDLRQQVQTLQQDASAHTATTHNHEQQPANDALSANEAYELRDAITTIAERVDTLADRIDQA